MKNKFIIGILVCDTLSLVLLLIGTYYAYLEEIYIIPYIITSSVICAWYINGNIDVWKDIIANIKKDKN